MFLVKRKMIISIMCVKNCKQKFKFVGSYLETNVDFFRTRYSNFGIISHRFWDTATHWLKIANYLYSPFI